MQKYSPLVILLCFALITGEVWSQSKGKPNKDTSFIEDSIVYYEIEIEGRQKNFKDLLVGIWIMDTMRRQARAVPDLLYSVQINFNSDSTFSVSTECGTLTGSYRLKGTSIKFMNSSFTNTACKFSEQESTLQKLLEYTVSAYTIENDILLLRDGSSNIIFRARRKRG